MDIDDMVLVSVDDHVVEPPHLFDGRLPAKYADLAPQFVTRDDGTNAWVYEGQEIANVALNAVAGRPPEEYGMEPTSFAELRAGCYDIDERVKDMDANGVLGSLCFPSFPQFCGQLFARTEDKDVALAMVQAYNDWHIDEWCGTHPGRFIPCSLPAIWDPEVLAAEVRRTAAKGAHAVTFSENPSKLGWPSFHSDHWDPFWQACRDEERRRVPAHRLVVAARDHGPRRPDRLPDHADADEHRPGRGRPRLVAGAAEVPRPARSPCPRAASAGSRTSSSASTTTTAATTPGPARTSATSCRARSSTSTSSRASSTTSSAMASRDVPQHGPRDVGVRLPALRLDVAVRPRGAGHAPRRRQRPRHRPDHAPQRHEALPVRPVHAPSAAASSCTVGALRASAAGHDVSIRSTNAAKVGQHASRAVDLSVPSAR